MPTTPTAPSSNYAGCDAAGRIICNILRDHMGMKPTEDMPQLWGTLIARETHVVDLIESVRSLTSSYHPTPEQIDRARAVLASLP